MDRENCSDKNLAALDELIEEITTDANSDDERFWVFRQAFEDAVTLPADGILRLSSWDNQGVGYLSEAVRAGTA